MASVQYCSRHTFVVIGFDVVLFSLMSPSRLFLQHCLACRDFLVAGLCLTLECWSSVVTIRFAGFALPAVDFSSGHLCVSCEMLTAAFPAVSLDVLSDSHFFPFFSPVVLCLD